jgi:predicted lipoprotein
VIAFTIAIMSCLISASICFARSSDAAGAFSSISRAAVGGIIPHTASAFASATSALTMQENRFCSLQTARISCVP